LKVRNRVRVVSVKNRTCLHQRPSCSWRPSVRYGKLSGESIPSSERVRVRVGRPDPTGAARSRSACRNPVDATTGAPSCTLPGNLPRARHQSGAPPCPGTERRYPLIEVIPLFQDHFHLVGGQKTRRTTVVVSANGARGAHASQPGTCPLPQSARRRPWACTGIRRRIPVRRPRPRRQTGLHRRPSAGPDRGCAMMAVRHARGIHCLHGLPSTGARAVAITSRTATPTTLPITRSTSASRTSSWHTQSSPPWNAARSRSRRSWPISTSRMCS
jgi:hypothetical protein